MYSDSVNRCIHSQQPVFFRTVHQDQQFFRFKSFFEINVELTNICKGKYVRFPTHLKRRQQHCFDCVYSPIPQCFERQSNHVQIFFFFLKWRGIVNGKGLILRFAKYEFCVLGSFTKVYALLFINLLVFDHVCLIIVLGSWLNY